MTKYQVTLMVGSFGVAAIDFASVGARGGPSPYLRVELSARAMSQHFRINVVQFQTRVQNLDKKLITVAEPIELGGAIAAGDAILKLEGPLSREALHFMGGQFRENRTCTLMLQLHSLLWFKDDSPPNQSITTSFVPAGQWGLVSTSQIDMFPVITRDDWFENVVKVIEPGDYVVLEAPIPTPPNRSRFEKALSHLATALEHFKNGNDPAVLQSCHGAFESLGPGAAKAILAKLSDVEKRKHVDALLMTAKNYLHAGRHISKTGTRIGEFDVDHRDAEFALGVTKMVVAYVARLLAE